MGLELEQWSAVKKNVQLPSLLVRGERILYNGRVPG